MMRTLWKGAVVPALTYGMEVLCWGNEVERAFERTQREVGLRAMGGGKLVPAEGLEGEFACSSFKVREARAKMAYKGRLKFMAADRVARKVYLYCGVQQHKTSFEKRLRQIETWKRDYGREVNAGVDEKRWVSTEIKGIEEKRNRLWRQGMEKKSSLLYYRTGQQVSWSGLYDGSRGSDLVFKARIGALETDWRIHYITGESGDCSLCGQSRGDLRHVLLECTELAADRVQALWGEENDCVAAVRSRLGLGRELEKNAWGKLGWMTQASRYLLSWDKKRQAQKRSEERLAEQ
jgi:hypothetical protein